MPIVILGQALLDCIAPPDGNLKPLIGGSPFNLARVERRHFSARTSRRRSTAGAPAASCRRAP